mgnify:FL=1
MALLLKAQQNKRKEGGSLRHKGSLTVESAFILPLFFLLITAFICILDLYRICTLVQTSLCEGAKELGMYAYCREEESSSPVGVVTNAVCIAYGTGKVRESLEHENLTGIQGGINGFILIGSGFQDDTVTLKASFLYTGPGGLFRIFPVRIQLLGQARAWTGYNGSLLSSPSSEDMVYIAEWESVYHTSRDCTHLALSITRVSKSGIENQTNQYGEHYYPCEKCMKNGTLESFVYITRTGSCCHSTRNCPGLTRTVTAVRKSDIEGLRACSRCAAQH